MDLDWMKAHVETLFLHDAAGRIVRVHEREGWPAPHFYLGRSRPANLWRFQASLPDGAIRTLGRLAAKEAPLPDIVPAREPEPEPRRMEAFRRVLVDEGIEIHSEYRGPAFRFPDATLGTRPDPDVVEIGPENAALLTGPFLDLAGRAPVLAALDDGRAVSVCHAARGVAETMVEAGVETLPSHRGRGLASRVVAAWADAVRRRGGVPLYSTEWGNAGSRSVARRLGLIQYGEDCHFS
ncbi:MAG: GNAT family N-acetyltransferase [Proteobacteria bacterium]|nr:GNAT family N-acetyltransferase [Pseudomonadota bacterium]